MAFKAKIDLHARAYVGKMLASNGGAHILNFLMEKDMENGDVVKQGDFVERDLYKATDGTGTKLVVRAIEPSGLYLLEVTEEADEFMLMQVPVERTGYETLEYTRDGVHYNGKDEIVRGRALKVHDTVLVDDKAIDGVVTVGAKIKVVASKLTVGA